MKIKKEDVEELQVKVSGAVPRDLLFTLLHIKFSDYYLIRDSKI